MNHEHFKPFNFDEFTAGAPIGCRGNYFRPRIHETIGDYVYGLILRENTSARPTSHEWEKSSGHDQPGGVLSPHDLVMLPLFLLDGKPVFVGDELVNDQGFPVKAGPLHNNSDGKWRWPAPKVETKWLGREMYKFYVDYPGDIDASFKAVEAAVIARAIQEGLVVVPGLQVSPRKLRDGDCFMDISEPGAPVGNIYGSQAAIDLVHERFAESTDEKLRALGALIWNAAQESEAAMGYSVYAGERIRNAIAQFKAAK